MIKKPKTLGLMSVFSLVTFFASCNLRDQKHGTRPMDPEHDEVFTGNLSAFKPIEPKTPKTSQCPDDMVLVEGQYCPDVVQECLWWVDSNGNKVAPPAPGSSGRCGKFRAPSTCKSNFKYVMKFCIDKYEYPNQAGVVPWSWLSWRDMKAMCESHGKRLPTRHEWTLACEGPDMHPYPYGDGYTRDKSACNFDNPQGVIDVFKAKSPKDETSIRLDLMLVPSGYMKSCVSPYGVHDQVGNIDESVVNESGKPYHSGLMGGHVFGVRNACRPMTGAHNEDFKWYETGGRCALSLPE